MPSIHSNGIDIHYDTTGSGPPLLLIHGLGSSGRDWEAQRLAFAGRYQVITFDLRGHGRSSKPPGTYAMATLAADAAALIRALRLPPVHLVGLSLGGVVAFQLMLDHPALVRSAVIVNSGPRLPASRAMLWRRRAMIRLLGLQRSARIVSRRLFPDPAQRAAFLEGFKDNQQGPYLASLQALAECELSGRLGEIRLPVLAVAADQDYTPVSFKQEYVDQLADARLVVIPDSHHVLPAERPAAFNAAVLEFLAGLGPA